MSSFFKIFFASFLALIIFCLISFFILVAIVSGLASKDKPRVEANSVLVIDLGQQYKDQEQKNIFSAFSGEETDVPALFDVVRLIKHAKEDEKIKGILIKAQSSPNGYAASEEIRNALIEFKAGDKFILAHGDYMTQNAYAVANIADRVYINPQGLLEWVGYSVDLAFLKGTLEKLDIVPQIFYAGKFKSATEPLRADKMSAENKLQTNEWLSDMYSHFLLNTSAVRKIDTTTLINLASNLSITNANDALNHKLVDGLKYDDEVKNEIKELLEIDKYDKISFIDINHYAEAITFKSTGSDRIALIYAEGNIVDGEGDQGVIGSEDYLKLIRQARLDKNIKAIVFRINSGGGSVMASENIWRELSIARKEKPVVVSFGDVSASGGYYIASAADSIFASPVTITGSIGVFGIIPNMQGFFKNKMGITFDGVKTAPHANMGAVYQPLSEFEQKTVQAEIDRIYEHFKQRVADGRNMNVAAVDSIAQGRVWSGKKALDIGLVDRFGGIQDAIDCAAGMADLTGYRIREYPESKGLLERVLGKSTTPDYSNKIKKQVGETNFRIYQEMMKVQEMTGNIQARLPFTFIINK
ncbi:MAG: signal peptide peptidase SppA [Chitinophagaceae bacterium]|jgi:protease-4|nr:signal peptide peptidase SppA [Chitinophagaceae bacterium]